MCTKQRCILDVYRCEREMYNASRRARAVRRRSRESPGGVVCGATPEINKEDERRERGLDMAESCLVRLQWGARESAVCGFHLCAPPLAPLPPRAMCSSRTFYNAFTHIKSNVPETGPRSLAQPRRRFDTETRTAVHPHNASHKLDVTSRR